MLKHCEEEIGLRVEGGFVLGLILPISLVLTAVGSATPFYVTESSINHIENLSKNLVQ